MKELTNMHAPYAEVINLDSNVATPELNRFRYPIMIYIFNLLLYACFWIAGGGPAIGEETICWPGFIQSDWFDEQVREIRFADGARAIVNAPMPHRFRDRGTAQLIVYATPNGNSAEQTLGCRLSEAVDWHFDIQHVAAQVRQWRAKNPEENIVLAVIQSDIRSWPTWRSSHQNAPLLIRRMVDSLAAIVPARDVKMILTGHSGGGSFIFGYMDAFEDIPKSIQRIAFLDANYGYSDDRQHGEKILRWLNADPDHQFVTLAYDDRNITLDGKKVVGPTGGTFRASYRMIDHLRKEIHWTEDPFGAFNRYVGLDGRMLVVIHPNPENKILHTKLVGEMNGLVFALAAGSSKTHLGERLEDRRTYTDWIQPSPYAANEWPCPGAAISRRTTYARDPSQIARELVDCDLQDRERIILSELIAGNLPDFLRDFVAVRVDAETGDGTRHQIVYRVMPDYLSVGSDDYFFRVPLTPQSAQHVADVFGCILPTRKMVDDIYKQSSIKLPPLPLAKDRESMATFLHHHDLIQKQLNGQTPGALMAGSKKDVVITNMLESRPGHVAIYGWHQIDGTPIQPLTTVHVDWYVDYSHAVRLIDQCALLDGKPARIAEVLADGNLHVLLSDEGPIRYTKYLDH
ncbi:MAG: hypothetical protein JW829_05495 [Pirellulales bacterium]|nr:hypothetical protein [Pirellulales bacterium]